MSEFTPTTKSTDGRSFFRRHSDGMIIGGAAALTLVLAGSGIAVGAGIASQERASSTQQQYQPSVYRPRPTSSATAATKAQQLGVVTILTTLYYDDAAQAAGTGIILSSSGEILTNNHVIQGATSIKVTVKSTGQTYTADVVGSDTTDDIAVLQLEGASGLSTATLDSSGSVAVGDAVTSIGNAEGTGDLAAAEGPVAALDQQITVKSDVTGDPENLSDLIEVSADVVSGDSGGPLLDADGGVVGIVTAASSGSRDVIGYAITVVNALKIVDQIEAGTESGNVTIGLPAFLGVTLGHTGAPQGAGQPGASQPSASQGASTTTITGTVAGSAAASAGLVAGDTITAVDDTTVTTGDQLSSAISAHQPGDSVTLTFTDSSGTAQEVAVTLGEGPAA